MRKIALIFSLALMSCLSFGQAGNPLRDSLDVATARLEQHPDSTRLRLERAHWNLQLEQWEYAKADYDLILRREPEQTEALFCRAFAYERLGRYAYARQDYATLLALVPGNFEVRLCLALLNDRDNRHTEAMDQMNELVEQHPDSAIAYAARAAMEADRGQHLLAEYDYTEAIVRDPRNTDYILGRAQSAIALGHTDIARRDLDMLVRLGIARAALAEQYRQLEGKTNR